MTFFSFRSLFFLNNTSVLWCRDCPLVLSKVYCPPPVVKSNHQCPRPHTGLTLSEKWRGKEGWVLCYHVRTDKSCPAIFPTLFLFFLFTCVWQVKWQNNSRLSDIPPLTTTAVITFSFGLSRLEGKSKHETKRGNACSVDMIVFFFSLSHIYRRHDGFIPFCRWV